MDNRFSSFVIGEGTLPLQCAQILLDRGHTVRAIVSSDAAVARWAEARNIPCLSPTSDFLSTAKREPFDYLFSIVNYLILPDELLALPLRGAINYHDAPLPRYAGTHATSWALMAREKEHAISWHKMATMVDGGDIYKQRAVDIVEGETSFSLNGKCYSAAIEAFGELVEEFANGRASAAPQNLQLRTFFGKYKRPAAAGALDWGQSANELAAFGRALDFGNYPNALCLPKLTVGQEFFIVSEAAAIDSKTDAKPGAITRIADNSIRVATASGQFEIRRVSSIDGEPLTLTEFIEKFQLHVGFQFPALDATLADRITEFNKTACKQEEFWVKRLAKLQPYALPLGNRTGTPSIATKQGELSATFPPEVLKFLNARGGEQVDFLVAAFGAFLSRIGGLGTFDIGFRPAEGSENSTGLEALFSSHVPLRIEAEATQKFSEIFPALREQIASAKSHLTYARDVVARFPQLKGNPDLRKPQKLSVAVELLRGFPGQPLPSGIELVFAISESSGECRWLYDANILDADTMQRTANQFAIFLQALVANSAQRIDDLPLLTEAEHQQLVVAWNNTAVKYPLHLCLHQLMEAQAERTPDALGLVFEDQRLTYRELNARANQLAHHLRKLGVGPDTLVGVCMERSVEMVVALHSILKAGGAYVPLDPDYPEDRLTFMLEDARVPVLLTQQRLGASLAKHTKTLLCLDSEWDKIAAEPLTNPMCVTRPEHLAYVIFTSGSTGRPKGAMNTLAGIVNRLLWMQDEYKLAAHDRVLQKTPFSFDVSVWEFFWPFLTGAALVVAKPRGHMDASYLVQLIAEQKVTTLHFVPSMLQVFLEEREVESCLSLKRVICSGEALPYELQERFFKRLNFELHNLYGPTEAAVDVTYWACQRNSPLRVVPIGRAIANTQIYILDSQMRPTPVGLPGELHIGGIGLARGYLNRPELTVEKFIKNPFSSEPGARLYKTGDLCRFLPDGNIEYLSRLDHQVKIRGFRIELGEIESAIATHPAVRETVVVAREDSPGNKRLVAYVSAHKGHSINITELRSYLKESLPDFMLPAAVLVLEALPLSPNGKVDRRALPEPDLSRPDMSENYVAPRTLVEEVLAGIWAEVLRLGRVGTQDNFFELGGNSLLATQVISRMRAAFKVELPLRSLFEAPRIAQLAEKIQAGQKASPGLQAQPIVPQPRKTAPPVSFAQERLWFLAQMEPGNPYYNIPGTVRLKGRLNQDALQRSLTEILRRHEALRTTFGTENGIPTQLIAPTATAALPVRDLHSTSAEGREAEAIRLAWTEAKRPFDLAHDPLIRFELVRVSAEDHLLFFTMHHIVGDGWSTGIFYRELEALYDAFTQGKESSLAPLPVQYADFVHWQRNWFQGEVLEEQLGYWRKQLAGAPPALDLPTDRPRPSVQSYRGATKFFTLPKNLTQWLKALSLQEDATLFMTLFAAFQTLLHRYSGQEDIVVGSPIANRNRGEIEGLIGFFVNMLALRTDLSGDPTFRELLRRVREVSLGAYAHQDMPFEKLVEALQPERDLSRPSLFQVMFILQQPLAPLKLSGLDTAALQLDSATAKFDLTLSMEERDDALTGWLEYSTDLFDETTMTRFLGHYQNLLEAIVAQREQKVSQLPMLSVVERQQLLFEWNDTQTPFPAACIHDLFEQQAARTPDEIAVVFEDRQLTYRELNSRANQLAHALQKSGVGPEVFVGVCMERSIEMVVSLLGILKAGGAYLPLDPEYPKDRLAFMIQDAKVPVLLTQKRLVKTLPEHNARVICVNTEWDAIAKESTANPTANRSTPENLAYVIYTSGSTGKPKGVMVQHRNAVNFFTGMDDRVGTGKPGVWLAVTSISFDISVLEIFWSLTRGFKVIVQSKDDGQNSGVEAGSGVGNRKMDFSLFYFASDQGNEMGNKYRLLLEGAKFADANGFSAVWTPERHFHAFGGLYPNPAVTSAAVAAVTKNIQIRAGSIVLPLHNPLRVAEEWSVVDNLSNGRVALSFASGWHDRDFIFAPENYKDRKDIMFRGIEQVRKLWRGETLPFKGGTGKEFEVGIMPKPVQKDVPIWITAAGSPETYRKAGEMGAHLLTHLLEHSVEELAEKIALYRKAWIDAGHGPKQGTVAVMLHTFVGEDLDAVREKVRKPMCDYLRTSVDLIKKSTFAKELVSKSTKGNTTGGGDMDFSKISEADMDAILNHAFERYFEASGLFGTTNVALQMANRLKAIGVDEIACLIDFHSDVDAVIESLRFVSQVRARANDPNDSSDYSIAAQLRRHHVTHFQCTPSMASMLVSDPKAAAAMKPLQKLMVGGEALPLALAEELRTVISGDLCNMYGPTETAVWSTTSVVKNESITIGRPIANTEIYIVDKQMQPVPVGLAGELLIGGAGVVRGYLNRPELTDEKFITNPFNHVPGARLYRTGDLARYKANGTIDFLGRLDHQVKIRGYRIELGEIEAQLGTHPAVKESVVVAREDSPGDKRIVAYVVEDTQYQDPADPPPSADQHTEKVSQWQMIWDGTYTKPGEKHDPTFNIIGWNSSYTGQPIPPAEMREWVDHIVGRFLALKPNRVMEIGCGTGLLMYGIAPHARQYYGIDFSPSAVRTLQQQLATLEPKLPHATVEQKMADDLGHIAPGSFDALIVNSVIQYFPDMDYLVRVLEGAVKVVAPGGHIFVGDVRSRALLETFLASIEVHQADPALTLSQLQQRVQKRVAQEEELLIDPAFFHALKRHLPQISRVEIQLKRGRHHNELTRFRYDVILHLSEKAPATLAAQTLDWQAQSLTLLSLRELLAKTNPEVLRVTRVPNVRLQTEVESLKLLGAQNGTETLNQLRDWLRKVQGNGVEPEDFWSLEQTLPYTVEIGWSGHEAEGYFDVIFKRVGIEGVLAEENAEASKRKSWSDYANPRPRKSSGKLVGELKNYLKVKLPDYMVPAAFMVLDALPRTPNGKTDRKALPAPDGLRPELEKSYVAPRTAVEEVLAQMWAEVLGVERVGMQDNFFDLGGHSLLATQLISRVRDYLKVELPLYKLFESATVEELARTIISLESKPGRVDKIAKLLKQVQSMSAEELATNIAARTKTN